MKITKDSLIADIIRMYPKVVEIFEKYNMGCTSCMGLQNESLEKGCLMHGLNVDDVIIEIETLTA
jgi:hybrid cluster-associated redox disulfide protein